MEQIIIDGSIHEGGGQIMRMSLGLSFIFEKSIRIHSVRKGRRNSGLGSQHLIGLNWLGLTHKLINGPNFKEFYVIGNKIKSTEFTVDVNECTFLIGKEPIPINTIKSKVSSVTLLAQLVLPCLEIGQIITIEGSTDTCNSPPMFFLTKVLLPTLKKLYGLDYNVKVLRDGYFSTNGRGTLNVSRFPDTDHDLSVSMTDQGQLSMIEIYAFQSHSHFDQSRVHKVEELIKSAKKLLKEIFQKNII